MPTKKVGCTLVTSHLKQFLEDYPSSSEKQFFLDIYHMLSLLDKYLYDHPKQHTHCMSSDNEYVTLIQYAICLHIDLTGRYMLKLERQSVELQNRMYDSVTHNFDRV